MIERSPDFNIIKDAINQIEPKIVLSVFRKACEIVYFEQNVQTAIKTLSPKLPIYLSLGQEFIPAAISEVFKNNPFFAQHRCHGWYLAYGGNPKALIDELMCLKSGICHGMAGSASIADSKIGMVGHSGLLGDQMPIATGYAIGSNKPVLCVAGDAAIEEDYALASFGFAASKKLPVLFICEDNNLSILTKIEVRRKWDATKVISSFGIKSFDITDDPWTIISLIKENINNLPCFINIRTCRKLWHAGAGCDGEPEWDRFEIIKSQLIQNGLLSEVKKIENESKFKMDQLWEEHLHKL